MTFEDLEQKHFEEWDSPLIPDGDAFCGFAARHDDGSLAALVVFYADEGDWWAALARRGVYPAKLHREIHRAMLAVKSVGGTIRAEFDPEIPRSREYLERLGFVPDGTERGYVKRWH